MTATDAEPSSRTSAPALRAQALAASLQQHQAASDHPWRLLAQAQQAGDRLGLARASLDLAQQSLDAGDLDEARWHLQRGRVALEPQARCAAAVTLQCELTGMILALAQRWHLLGEPMLGRRLADDVRDTSFEVARNCLGLDDVAVRVSALLRVAEMLELLGDASDAQALRMQAFNGLGRGAVIAN